MSSKSVDLLASAETALCPCLATLLSLHAGRPGFSRKLHPRLTGNSVAELWGAEQITVQNVTAALLHLYHSHIYLETKALPPSSPSKSHESGSRAQEACYRGGAASAFPKWEVTLSWKWSKEYCPLPPWQSSDCELNLWSACSVESGPPGHPLTFNLNV